MLNSEQDMVETIETFESNLQSISTLKSEIEEIKKQLEKYKNISDDIESAVSLIKEKVDDLTQNTMEKNSEINGMVLATIEGTCTFLRNKGEQTNEKIIELSTKKFDQLSEKLELQQEETSKVMLEKVVQLVNKTERWRKQTLIVGAISAIITLVSLIVILITLL